MAQLFKILVYRNSQAFAEWQRMPGVSTLLTSLHIPEEHSQRPSNEVLLLFVPGLAGDYVKTDIGGN